MDPLGSVTSRAGKWAMIASLGVAVLMLVGKLTAYFLTGSAAILADAAESVVHGAATAFAAVSLWYAEQPADAAHPYGHGRIAYFSAGFEGGLVSLAGLAVVFISVRELILGVQLQRLGWGLAIAGSLAVINLVLGTLLVRIGRQQNQLVLVANGKHVLADVWTTAGALLGIGLVMLTGVRWLDPLAGIVLGGVILLSGIRLAREAIAGLMDQADPETSRKLCATLRSCVERGEIDGYHELRFRSTNNRLWLDVHLLMPSSLPLSEAHQRATRVEQCVQHALQPQRVHITSHVEPAPHEQAHPEGHRGAADPLR